jgi:hypothetical protein
MVGAAQIALPDALPQGEIHAAMGAVVPEGLHLAMCIPEKHQIGAQDPEAHRLAPAHVFGRQGRVPVLPQAQRRNQAPSVVGVIGLDERRWVITLIASGIPFPSARIPAADLVECP